MMRAAACWLIVGVVACTPARRGAGGGGDVDPGAGAGGDADPGGGHGPEGGDASGGGGEGAGPGDPGEGEGEGEGQGPGPGEGEGEGEDEGADLCADTCGPRGGTAGSWAADGRCDDGGPGSVTAECALGTDCADCGRRSPPGGTGPGEEWDGPVLCEDTCGPRGAPAGTWANDGACDDGGPGATYNECPIGTDCTDCGPRGCNREHPCDGGLVCREGQCVIDDAGLLAAGPPACDDVPDWRCQGGEASCGEIVPFEPDLGEGWWDYPLNGETERDQYRSFIRRDVMMLVQYAAASVECMGAAWRHGNHDPLGLGDMSEADGSIPGTRERDPGHPPGTHVDGHDMDIAYYQVGTPDNTLRPVCEHVEGRADAYRCVAEPTLLDPWRTALFIAKLHASPQLRVIGVDGKVGPLLTDALDALCARGWLPGSPACRPDGRSLAFEPVDEGRGWYLFHHHHLHISVTGGRRKRQADGASAPLRGPDACITPDCSRP